MSIHRIGGPALLAMTLSLAACQEPNQPAPAPAAPAATAEPGPAPAPPATPGLAAPGFVELDEAARLRELGVLQACNLEAVAGEGEPAFTARRGGDMTVTGWVANASADGPAGMPVLRLTRTDGPGVWELALATGEDRPDVAQALSAPGLAAAGFRGVHAVGELPAGTYSLVLVDKTEPLWRACDNGRVLRVLE